MHRQTLRMSLALARNVRAVFRRPLHARDAEQRSGRRHNAPVPIQEVCERERRPQANQADGAARMHARRVIERLRVRRLIRNVRGRFARMSISNTFWRVYGIIVIGAALFFLLRGKRLFRKGRRPMPYLGPWRFDYPSWSEVP